ncbi:AMP-binding protein [Gordonia sp. SL306]|uniref:AMP-binding protein n=1 Tax=Gordonia sp. SL306 TaxID=2995145 RepID=UPI00226FA279|nr:AMP-binding protein [Gordonia sp. SL306]WAC57062.1 AMP-binding protein [Gordonia sp. SL306]
MKEWTVGEILDAVTGAVPDREMTICGTRRTTYAESARRTTDLARYLASRGLGAHTHRDDLDRWECGQDRVALIMHNDLYVDVFVACLRGRVIPVNINHHYSPREIKALLEHVRPSGVIFHRSLAHLIAEATLPAGVDVLVAIEDADGSAIPGSVSLDDALEIGATAQPVTPSPDDLMMVCTGGTTGLPKGVLWRQADAYISTMTGMEHESAEAVVEFVPETGEPFFAVSPLMHAAGISTALSAVVAGRTAVIYDNRGRFDARSVLETAEREKARILTIVGDAYAGPLVAELRTRSYDLSSLIGIGSGGAAINPRHKSDLLELLPHIVILDTFGSSETGGMATSPTMTDSPAETFVMHPSGRVVSDDRTRFLEVGDGELGWIARTGRVPLGYFEDQDATLRTFPEIDGVRVSIPGDRAHLEADGSIRLHGRDSLVINSGGEKIFVEEVEEILRGHPAVVDALVVGRPSSRWGTEVVAVVALDPGGELTVEELRAFTALHLSRFKVPKKIVLVDKVERLANGKADYRWAKSIVAASRADTMTVA